MLGHSGLPELLAVLRHSPVGGRRLLELITRLATTASVTDTALDFLTQPIVHDGRRLGTIVLGGLTHPDLPDVPLAAVAEEFAVPPGQHDALQTWLRPWHRRDRRLAAQVLRLMADIIARLAAQSFDLHNREVLLDAVNHLSALLSGTADLQDVLDTIARQVCEVMQVKASSIRLLDEQTNELRIKSVHNLSEAYLAKGSILLDENPIDREAITGKVVYVEDARTDSRIRFREQASKEGIVSGLSVGMTYRGQTIGVMRVYTAKVHHFTTAEIALIRSIASQAAAAIIHSRLYLEALTAERYHRQLAYAGEIQRRMIPDAAPAHRHIDFAYVYEPSFDVGGDFFDFYALPESEEVGLCIADVVGKGMPAALMMASLRTAFRLYAYSVMEITEVMTMINIHMHRETMTSEFATMFYGLFSHNARRLTFICAGHDPPLHCRQGRIRELSTGDFVIGVSPTESFHKKHIALRRGDVVLFYTDGIVDAQNFAGENFGRDRLADSLKIHAVANASQIARNIIWDVRRFVGLADQADDITMVVAKIR